MRSCFVLVTALLCASMLTISVSAADCHNPMFQRPIKLFSNQNLSLSPTPIYLPDPSNAVCPDTANDPQCCYANTFELMQTQMKKFDEAMEQIQQIRKQNLIGMILDQLKQRYGYKDAQLNVIRHAYNFIDSQLDINLKCSYGIFGYFNGMLCLACHADYHSWYNVETNAIKLEQNTCTKIADACMPMYARTAEILIELLDIVAEYLQAFPNPDIEPAERDAIIAALRTVQKTVKGRDLCEEWDETPNAKKSCKGFLCNTYLRGLDLHQPNMTDLIPANLIPNIPSIRGFHHLFNAVRSQNIPLALKHLSTLSGTSTHAPLQHVFSSFSLLHPHSAIQVTSFGMSSLRASSAEVTNEYVASGGYAAYKVGCETTAFSKNACTDPAPEEEKLPVVAIVFIVIGSILVLFVAIYVIRTCMNRSSPPTGYVPTNDSSVGSYVPPTVSTV